MSSSGSYALADMPEEQRQRHAASGRKAQLLRITREDGKADYVNTNDIASRFNITADEARLRLKREQKLDGPVTWAGLALKSRSKK